MENYGYKRGEGLLPKQVECFFGDALNSCRCRETHVVYTEAK